MATREDPTSAIELITPIRAKKLLAVNSSNRKPRKNKITQYATDMRDDNWKLTGEAVKVSVTGRLLDGQHRLMAVVESGSAVEMFVIRGLPDDVQPYLDTGIARNAADNLYIAGEANASVLSSASRLGSIVDRGLLYRDRKAQLTSHAQVYEWVHANPAIRRSVAYVSTGEPNRVLLAPAVRAYSHFRFAAVDADAADEFFASVGSMVNIPAGSPIHALSSRLFQLRNKNVKANSRDLLDLVFRAWNAWRSGRKVRTFPLVTVDTQLPPLV